MTGFRATPKTRRTLWVILSLFCCALIALSGTVQVAHFHADGRAAQPDCVVCHTAHVVAQAPVAQSLQFAIFVVALLSAAPQPIRRQCVLAFPLYTRPPPVDPAFS